MLEGDIFCKVSLFNNQVYNVSLLKINLFVTSFFLFTFFGLLYRWRKVCGCAALTLYGGAELKLLQNAFQDHLNRLVLTSSPSDHVVKM